MMMLADILKTADRSGMAHNGGVRGDYLLAGTEEQLIAFVRALTAKAGDAEPAPAPASIHTLLARDVVEQWRDIDLAFQTLYEQAQGLASSQWYSARTKAARMYTRATQALSVPVDSKALALMNQQFTGPRYK